MKKLLILALLALSCVMFSSSVIIAADFPTKPVTLINPWPAGTPPDLVARALAKAASKYMSQPMTVVIKSGGAGTIGIQNVLSSKPNGYTIGFGGGLLLTLQPHRAKLAWNSPDDYTVLGRIANIATVLVVQKDAPYDTLQEFIDYMKANPNQVKMAINAVGNIDGISAVDFLKRTGTEARLVPGATSLVPILGKHADAMIGIATQSSVEFKDQVKMLCVLNTERYKHLPEVPTVREAGVDMDGISAYYVIFGPKGMPDDVKKTLEDIISKAANDPEFLADMDNIGMPTMYEDAKTAYDRLMREYNDSKVLVEEFNLKEE